MNSIDFGVFNETSDSGKDIVDSELPDNEPQKEISYILIIGRGGGDHDAPDLTDTIILAGINHVKESITLFSIPRDLWVKYPGTTRKGKINRIYENEALTDPELGIQNLKDKVTQITGKDIDYHVSVDFKGFIEVVDTLGGVDITLEKNFVDYQYPDGNLGYKTFILRKGTWTLDGEVALMYARSRHSSSDFDRSLRQQEIIGALKEKISELYFNDVTKIVSLYNTFTKHVETDMPLKELVNLGVELKSWEKTEFLSFNINDTCYQGSDICDTGGLLYVPLRDFFGGASVLLPNEADAENIEEYSEIQAFADLIYSSPEIYLGDFGIHIYNGTGVGGVAGRLSDTFNAFGLNIDRYNNLHTLRNWSGEKNIIYYNELDSDHPLITMLENTTGITAEQRTESTQKEGGDIEIILTQTTDTIQ